MARKLTRYCTKKRPELEAVIDYYSNRITGDEFVGIMNSFVASGERTGKIREGGPPFTLLEGRELALIAAGFRRVAESDFEVEVGTEFFRDG
jgi:hypothetical protein